MKHANIAFFIPHLGCPHQCTFCNQIRITGQRKRPDPQDVSDSLKEALSDGRLDPETTEIAFFGGSFTAVPQVYQDALLAAASPYVRSGLVHGIRISTRPDAIDSEILERLHRAGVTAIELGAQSMRDDVLALCRRGHTAQQVRDSSRLIRRSGFSLGLQMMTGLEGDDPAGTIRTAEELSQLGPDTVRIYPTLVMRDTELEERWRSGRYQPAGLEETVDLCAQLLDLFETEGIRVIRLGLHDSKEVSRCLAGPYHPAFAELCYSRRYLVRFLTELADRDKGQIYDILVNPRELSRAIGQKRQNCRMLEEKGWQTVIRPAEDMPRGQFRIEERG